MALGLKKVREMCDPFGMFLSLAAMAFGAYFYQKNFLEFIINCGEVPEMQKHEMEPNDDERKEGQQKEDPKTKEENKQKEDKKDKKPNGDKKDDTKKKEDDQIVTTKPKDDTKKKEDVTTKPKPNEDDNIKIITREKA